MLETEVWAKDSNFNGYGGDPNMGRRSFCPLSYGGWVPLVALPSSVCLPTELSQGQFVVLVWQEKSFRASYLHLHICRFCSRLNVLNSNYTLSSFQHRLKLQYPNMIVRHENSLHIHDKHTDLYKTFPCLLGGE
jgi:hypothetical protein